MNNLALAYRDAGRLAEAIPLYEQTLAARRKKLGADHPDTLTSMNNLAAAYLAAGRLDEALPLFEQTLAARRKKLGADHPDTLASMNNLAAAYRDAGRLDEALPLLEQTLAAQRKKLGADHPDTLKSMDNLTVALNEFAWSLATSPTDNLRDGKRAVQLATRACELSEHKQPGYISTLAAAYAETGDFDSAVKWSQRSMELLGENGAPKMRARFVSALAKYKNKKPMRQETPQANVGGFNQEQPVQPVQANVPPVKTEVPDTKRSDQE
jgi:tetratricopeptide (TPR) repeat protein